MLRAMYKFVDYHHRAAFAFSYRFVGNLTINACGGMQPTTSHTWLCPCREKVKRVSGIPSLFQPSAYHCNLLLCVDLQNARKIQLMSAFAGTGYPSDSVLHARSVPALQLLQDLARTAMVARLAMWVTKELIGMLIVAKASVLCMVL